MKEELKKILKDRLFVLFCVFFAVCIGCVVAVSLINYSEHSIAFLPYKNDNKDL